jgi:hypothetical protein
MPAQRLFLFGDQTGETLPSLQDLAKSAIASQNLANFLRVCTEEIRNAINSAPVRYQEYVPQFASVLELATRVEETKNTRLAINTALLCVAQFGHVILYVTCRYFPYFLYSTKRHGLRVISRRHELIKSIPVISSLIPQPSRMQTTGQQWSASAQGFSPHQPSAVAVLSLKCSQ